MGWGLLILGVIPDLDSLHCALVDHCLRSVDHELGMGAEPIINRSTNIELELVGGRLGVEILKKTEPGSISITTVVTLFSGGEGMLTAS